MSEWEFQPAKDTGLSTREAAKSLRRESGLISTVGHLLWWSYIHTYLRVYHRLKVEGKENIPHEPPFVLIANHASHLDALVLGAPMPWRLRDRVFPIAAGDVFFEAVTISLFATSFINALPIWRKNVGPKALAELRQRLVDEPCAYILFPEGGRTRDGNLMPFKPGLGMMIAGTKVPVVPCHLDGTFAALPAGRKVAPPHRIRLRIGKPLVFADVENRRAGWEKVAEDLKQAVVDLGSK